MLFHFISEAVVIQEERHANAAVSSLILFFYLSGSYFQFLEAFAEFRAITGGTVITLLAPYCVFKILKYTRYYRGQDLGLHPAGLGLGLHRTGADLVPARRRHRD